MDRLLGFISRSASEWRVAAHSKLEVAEVVRLAGATLEHSRQTDDQPHRMAYVVVRVLLAVLLGQISTDALPKDWIIGEQFCFGGEATEAASGAGSSPGRLNEMEAIARPLAHLCDAIQQLAPDLPRLDYPVESVSDGMWRGWLDRTVNQLLQIHDDHAEVEQKW